MSLAEYGSKTRPFEVSSGRSTRVPGGSPSRLRPRLTGRTATRQLRPRALGRKILADIAGIVAPDTILRWYRRLVARKYDGSKKRGPDRPPTKREIADLVVCQERLAGLPKFYSREAA